MINAKQYKKALEYVNAYGKLLTDVPRYMGEDIKDTLNMHGRKKSRKIAVVSRTVNVRNFLLGYLYMLNKDYDLAEEYFKTSLNDNLMMDDYIYSMLAACKRARADLKSLYEINNRIIDLSSVKNSSVQNIDIVSDAYFESGEYEVMNGNCNSGLKKLDKYLKLKNFSTKHPLALYLKAQCFEKNRKINDALKFYKELWLKYYNPELAQISWHKLEDLKCNPTLKERLKNIRNMARIKGYEVALLELQKLKNVFLDNPSKFVSKEGTFDELLSLINFEIGFINFSIGNFDIARDTFKELIAKNRTDEDILFQLAMSYRKLGDYDSSYQTLQKLLDMFSRSGKAAYYHYLMGQDLMEKGDLQRAEAHFNIILRDYKSSKYYDDAYWTMGFSNYLRGELEAATKYFAGYHEDIELEVYARGKGLYWIAKSLMKLGERDKAINVYQELVKKYPFSFYSWMAISRLSNNREFLEKIIKYLPERYIVSADAYKNMDYSFEKKLNGKDHYFRGTVLKMAGLKKSSIYEYNQLYNENFRNKSVLHNISNLLYTVEDFYRSSYIIAIHDKLDDLADSIKENEKEFLFLYPMAYFDFVKKYGNYYKIDPFLTLSIMKSESIFREEIKSHVGAVGLMQLMPSTAHKAAGLIGNIGDFDSNLLTEPELNINLGTFYLRKLMNDMDNNITLVVASYNAGPHKVQSWIKDNKATELDEFIELIPYFETRNYVKKVLSYYGTYIYLYNVEKPYIHLDVNISDELKVGPVPVKEVWQKKRKW